MKKGEKVKECLKRGVSQLQLQFQSLKKIMSQIG